MGNADRELPGAAPPGLEGSPGCYTCHSLYVRCEYNDLTRIRGRMRGMDGVTMVAVKKMLMSPNNKECHGNGITSMMRMSL